MFPTRIRSLDPRPGIAGAMISIDMISAVHISRSRRRRSSDIVDDIASIGIE